MSHPLRLFTLSTATILHPFLLFENTRSNIGSKLGVDEYTLTAGCEKFFDPYIEPFQYSTW